MVEIRVAVEEDAVHSLMRKLVGVFGRAAVSFDTASNEVHVRSDWGSRAVDEVIRVLQSGLAEAGVRSATLAVGDVAYTVVAP